MTDDEKTINRDDLRMIFTGAAGVLEAYALSPSFNYERDIELLRPIVQNVERLMAILDAAEQQHMNSVSPAD